MAVCAEALPVPRITLPHRLEMAYLLVIRKCAFIRMFLVFSTKVVVMLWLLVTLLVVMMGTLIVLMIRGISVTAEALLTRLFDLAFLVIIVAVL